MTGKLTLTETGTAELRDDDKGELLRMIRAVIGEVEDLYRPAQTAMEPGRADTDPVLQGLWEARDRLIGAENSLLGIRRRVREREAGA